MSRFAPRLLKISLSLALAFGALSVIAPAIAAAPQVKTQAPGFYRMMLGDFEITALNDGTVDLPMDKLLAGGKKGEVAKAFDKVYLKAPIETSVNAYLVNTGSKLVLIDTGAAGLFGPTLGKLLANLKAAGYTPDQVDEIYITHLHPDHVGGLLTDGKIAFPNAIVRMDKHDADYWLSAQNLEKAPADGKGFFQGAQASVKPYADAGRIKPFEGETELVPGIRAVATPGHTPGHSFYVVESKGQKLVVWGDVMHAAAVQFPDPSITIAFDTDSKLAGPVRKKAFADAAKAGYWVAIAHVAFPGIGHLRAEGKGYRWVPVNYSSKP